MKPLITCVCVTERRVQRLRKAIDCFLSQSYSNKELLLVVNDDDFETLNYTSLLEHPDIRVYVVTSAMRLSLGERRNISLQEARGEYFCQWDDDDWYHNDRLELQINTALQNNVQGSVLLRLIFYNAENGKSFISFARPWENSILCKRSVLDDGFKYKDINKQEDTIFVNELIANNKLCFVNSYPAYIYVYHGSNSWDQSHFNMLFSISNELPGSVSKLIKGIIDSEYDCREGSSILSSDEIRIEIETVLQK